MLRSIVARVGHFFHTLDLGQAFPLLRFLSTLCFYQWNFSHTHFAIVVLPIYVLKNVQGENGVSELLTFGYTPIYR